MIHYELADIILSENSEHIASKFPISLCSYHGVKINSDDLVSSTDKWTSRTLQQNDCSPPSTVGRRKSTKLVHKLPAVDPCLQLSAMSFHQCLLILFDAYETLIWTNKTWQSYCTAYWSFNSNYAKGPNSMSYLPVGHNVSQSIRKITPKSTFAQPYYDRKVRPLPEFSIGEMVFADRPPLVTVSTDSNADKYNELLLWAYGPFQMLELMKHTLTVNEIDSPNTILIDQATPGKRAIYHPRRTKASKTSSQDKTTLCETNAYTEVWITQPLLEDSRDKTEIFSSIITKSYTKTLTTSPSLNDFIKETELSPLKHSFTRTSLEENYYYFK